jgi:hypothetical protein
MRPRGRTISISTISRYGSTGAVCEMVMENRPCQADSRETAIPMLARISSIE